MYLVAYFIDEFKNEKLGSSANYNKSTINRFEKSSAPVLKLDKAWSEFLKVENLPENIDISELLEKKANDYVNVFESLGIEDASIFLDFVRSSKDFYKIKLLKHVSL